jgi:cysteine-rich repeat protein
MNGGGLSEFDRAVNRAKLRMSFFCGVDDPVRTNYGGGSVEELLPGAVERLLEESGSKVQGVVPAVTGGAIRKARRRCRRAVAQARSAVVRSTLARALRCQTRIDARAGTFGAIESSCLTGGAGRVVTRARALLERQCSGLMGLDVGSCDPLPSCVIDAASVTGRALARLAFGGAAACGNGFPELGEECDDGNTDSTDACTDQCVAAECLDGIVQVGVEACDDGNNRNDDCCTTECKAPVCGDGVVSAPCEECDDVKTPDDCVGCRVKPTVCDGSGVVATVAVDWQRAGTTAPLRGVRFDLRYVPGLTILHVAPGFAFVDESRVSPLVANAIFSGQDLDRDGDGIEETLDMLFVDSSPRPFPSGDIGRIQFDCPGGLSLLPSAFSCTLTQASDQAGNPVEDYAQVPCSVTRLRLVSAGP